MRFSGVTGLLLKRTNPGRLPQGSIPRGTPDPALSRLESQLTYRNSNVMITDVVSQKANDTMPNSKQAYILADILSRCVLCLYSMARQTVYGFPRTDKNHIGNERIGWRLMSLINLNTQLI